jgi:hypothetical protein
MRVAQGTAMPARRDIATISAAIAVASSAIGCAEALSEPTADERPPRYGPEQCVGVDGAAALTIIWNNLESAEPVILKEWTPKGAPFERVIGLRLHIRPTSTVTAESLERGLRCELTSETHERPTVLAGCVDGRVDSDGDGFAITLLTSSSEASQLLLGKARRPHPVTSR